VSTVLGRPARACRLTLLAGAGPKALTSVDLELQPSSDGVGYMLVLPHAPEMGSYPIAVRAVSLEGKVRRAQREGMLSSLIEGCGWGNNPQRGGPLARSVCKTVFARVQARTPSIQTGRVVYCVLVRWVFCCPPKVVIQRGRGDFSAFWQPTTSTATFTLRVRGAVTLSEVQLSVRPLPRHTEGLRAQSCLGNTRRMHSC